MMRTPGGRFVAGRIVYLFALLTAASGFSLALAPPELTPASSADFSPANFAPANQATPAQDQSAITQLEPGTPIERTLTGADVHRYQLTLQKGQCAVIQVEQRGINVAVRLLGDSTDPVIEVDDKTVNRVRKSCISLPIMTAPTLLQS